MLANRADICNIGDAALVTGGGAGGGVDSPFARSYIDNALVAHPVLKPLTTRPLTDVARLLAIAGGDDTARSDLSHPYAPVELTEIVAVLRHLQHIQRALMTVNQAYIASAGQSDEDRIEPPFKLQGSYRDMGKLTARVVPAHTPAEIDHLLRQHYRQEAQTLTHGAEANMLKLHELLGWPNSIEDQARWAHICRGFARRTELGGDDNPARQAVIQLAKVVEALTAQSEALTARREAPPQAPKVEIINTLPAYYAKLYEHHLHVLESSLIPVLDLLGRYAGNQAKTRSELEAVADEMRAVLAKQRRAGRIELDEP